MFNKGDRVKCVDDQDTRLIKGIEYIVKKNSFGLVELEALDGAWYPRRFQYVAPPLDEMAQDLIAEYRSCQT